MELAVSLTSLPSRLCGLVDVFNSLSHQRFINFRVLLHLPYVCGRTGEEYDLCGLSFPDFVEIYRYDFDYGPALKLYGALCVLNDPCSLIVTIDDDMYYNANLLYDLYLWHSRLCRSALGFVGGRMFGDFSTLIHGEELCEPLLVDGLGGYRGILYCRWMFDKDVVERELLDLFSFGIFLADDSYFSSYLCRFGISRYVIPCIHGNFVDKVNVGFLNRADGIYWGSGGGGDLIKSSESRLCRYHNMWLGEMRRG